MGTTRPICDDQTVKVHTFYGGEAAGRCFTIISEQLGIQRTFTQAELNALLQARPDHAYVTTASGRTFYTDRTGQTIETCTRTHELETWSCLCDET